MREGAGPPEPIKPVVENPEGEPPGGPFGTWASLYATVAAWAVLWILLLWFLTVTLNVPVAPAAGGLP